MSQLRDAAVEGDADDLKASIDFPAVRESLKEQLRAELATQLASSEEQDGFAAFGAVLAMGMVDPEELAGQRPFDLAFIDAMIPHHKSAIEMARVALDQSDNGEIRSLARNIVDSQKQEISQMQQWREEWYPEK